MPKMNSLKRDLSNLYKGTERFKLSVLLLNADGSTDPLEANDGAHALFTLVNALDLSKVIGFLTSNDHPKSNVGWGFTLYPKDNSLFYAGRKLYGCTEDGDEAKAAIAAFNRFTDDAVETARIKSDDVARFEFEMGRHDLYYEMSDDHNVWAGGRASRARIVEVKNRLGADHPEVLRIEKEKKFSYAS